jgi:hypothetical protein
LPKAVTGSHWRPFDTAKKKTSRRQRAEKLTNLAGSQQLKELQRRTQFERHFQLAT